jgi:uncharacterized SAM-dependent methyltransferase
LSAKSIEPNEKLFEVFSYEQVSDIIRNLELHGEAPRQYGYFGEGAQEWDDYIIKQLSVQTPSVVKREIELLAANRSYIDQRLSKFKRVNIVDIGVGNAAPVRGLLAHLIEQGKLGRYIAIDTSPDMLRIAERNLRSWFGDAFSFEGHIRDIACERFADVLAKDYIGPDEENVNLILFLGATPTNLRVPEDAFRTICESMYPNDILIYTDKVEAAEEPPEWFRHSYKNKPKTLELLVRHRFVLDLLGISESLYTAEVGFDRAKRQKYASAELKFALTLKINFGDSEKILQFEKGDKIVVWRCWRMTQSELVNLMARSGLYTFHSSQTEDRYILTIAEPNRV